MQALEWLLERNNPAVRVRALAELCGLPYEHPDLIEARKSVLSWTGAAEDLGWMSEKGLVVTYSLTALAESGLTREDVPIDSIVDRVLAGPFDSGCGDMMILRALVMLGYCDDMRLRNRLTQAVDAQLPDGGLAVPAPSSEAESGAENVHKGCHARLAFICRVTEARFFVRGRCGAGGLLHEKASLLPDG